jgi:hypothetical protein
LRGNLARLEWFQDQRQRDGDANKYTEEVQGMNLSRRSFLGMLGLGAATAAVAPTYFFAPIGGWKSDTIINPLYNEVSAAELEQVRDYLVTVTPGFYGKPMRMPSWVEGGQVMKMTEAEGRQPGVMLYSEKQAAAARARLTRPPSVDVSTQMSQAEFAKMFRGITHG